MFQPNTGAVDAWMRSDARRTVSYTSYPEWVGLAEAHITIGRMLLRFTDINVASDDGIVPDVNTRGRHDLPSQTHPHAVAYSNNAAKGADFVSR